MEFSALDEESKGLIRDAIKRLVDKLQHVPDGHRITRADLHYYVHEEMNRALEQFQWSPDLTDDERAELQAEALLFVHFVVEQVQSKSQG